MERNPHRYIDDASLSARLKEKDSRLLDYLFDRYGAPLYGIIYRIVSHEKIAEEILHDTFRTVWEKADAYDPERMRFFTWIMAIARKLAQQRAGLSSTNPAQEHDLVQQAVLSKQALADHGKSVKDLLDKLPPEEREVVHSVIFAGRSLPETARQLNTSVETITNRLRTALLTLREILQPLS